MKPLLINLRTCLEGIGASLALPLLESIGGWYGLKSPFRLVGLILVLFSITFEFQAADLDSPVIYYVDGIELNSADRVLLASVQGLANRDDPMLFVISRKEDVSWLKIMEEQMQRPSKNLSLAQAIDLFAQGKPQVLWEPNRPWTLSIATTMAGLKQALLTARQFPGRDIMFDTRGLSDKVSAYEWAIAELATNCNQSRLFYLDEVLAPMRDFAIQQKLFAFNFDPLNDPVDIRLLDRTLARFAPGTEVFGWATGAYARKDKHQDGVSVENALIDKLSKRGMSLAASDFSGNLSFYSRATNSVYGLKQVRLARNLKYDPSKRYIMLLNSDGDNLQYDLGDLRERWDKPDRLKVPLSWTISPQLAECAPIILHSYFQESAARGGWDEFVAGPSGSAYFNPGTLSPSDLARLIERTRVLCASSDLRSIAILDHHDRPSPQVYGFIGSYARAGFDALWLVAMPKYVGIAKQMAFRNERFRLGSNSLEIARQINSARLSDPFFLVYMDAWGSSDDDLVKLMEGLDQSSVFVSASEMADLVRQWIATNLARREISATPEHGDGLFPVALPDGDFSVDERNGSKCWRIHNGRTPQYFYWDADTAFRGGNFEIELQYLDVGTSEIILHYDSTDLRAPQGGAYKNHPLIVRKKNTESWLVARFRISDARFNDSQNGQSDFRFFIGAEDLWVRNVRVRRI